MDKFYHKTCILSIFEFSVEKIFLSFSVNAHHFEPKDVVKGTLLPISVARIKLTLSITLVIIFSGFADTTLADKSAKGDARLSPCKFYERKFKIMNKRYLNVLALLLVVVLAVTAGASCSKKNKNNGTLENSSERNTYDALKDLAVQETMREPAEEATEEAASADNVTESEEDMPEESGQNEEKEEA